LSAKAREFFVDSVDGCYFLIKVLVKGEQPIPRFFSVVRNVHHLISSMPGSIPKMDQAVAILTMDKSSEEK